MRGIPLAARHLPSRVKGSHAILKRLRSVLIANARTLVGRDLGEAAQQWHSRVHELIGRLVGEGDVVLPVCPDPRDRRRVRKRRGQLF